MGTGIKNGEQHTFNIYSTTLFFLFICVLSISSFASGSYDGKERIIVIDPGHGGRDPGALGAVSREKDITLAISLKTGEYIEKNIKNVKVIYTRKDDATVDLYERPKIANKVNADLFISIHANSASSRNVIGAESYVMGHAKDQANLEVAMKENAVMLREEDYSTKYEGFDPKSSESYIMFSLTQKVFQEQSTDLASRIQTQFRERVNRNDRDVKQAGFWVLYNTKMPSVLIETGFITSPTEEKYLISKEGQDYLAASIFRACKEYFDAIDSRTANPVIKAQNTLSIADSVVKTDSSVITFMVQFKSSLTRLKTNSQNFKGANDVIEINAGNRFIYASGNFPDYSSAVSYRKKIEALYPGAFVIALQYNKILPLQQALDIKRKTKLNNR